MEDKLRELTFFKVNWNIYITLHLLRADDEQGSKTTTQKQLREVTNQMQELQEDLEAEREARTKAEKQKRDLNEVSSCLLMQYLSFPYGFYTKPKSVLNLWIS